MKKSFHFRVKSAGEICLNNKLSYGNHSSLTINTKKMKTFELKSLNGKWYQGQLVIRYNLLNVLRVLILAALAAVALAILYWIVKGANLVLCSADAGFCLDWRQLVVAAAQSAGHRRTGLGLDVRIVPQSVQTQTEVEPSAA